ncbi:MAG: TetR/AcrR family transcriptional regulator [Lachnospiraceae bacterium]|nr:TetR/AcrR family transcriptional regulator [Lachnospiraceae bacterium]
MDLRIERTRRSIINAFIELRSQKPIEKITIKELAELACINKATFYSHYHDIYDLTEQLENEIINSIVEGIPDTVFLNPKEDIEVLFEAFLAKKSLTDILFSGSRSYAFAQKMEQILKKHIYKIDSDSEISLEQNILFSVLVQGTFRAYWCHSEKDLKEVIQILGNINDCLVNKYVPISDK